MDHADSSPSTRAAAPERLLARGAVACLASLAVHGITLGALYAVGALGFLVPSRPYTVALRPLDAAAWEANRGLSGAAAAIREEPRQVVALPPDAERDPARESRPPPGRVRFLAERDQTVDRETISRHAGSYAKLLRVPQDRVRGRQGSGERGQHKIAVQGREGPPGGGGTDADAAVPLPPEELVALAAPSPPEPTAEPGLAPGDPALPTDGEGGQRIDGRRLSGLPLREYPRPEGGPSAADGRGAEEGAETRLHARRFAPAQYWTTVRAQLEGDWQRRIEAMLKEHDPFEETYFYKERSVLVAVTLDPKGGVADVHVVESSRLDFYDAVAVAAVRGKQPYPPPPPAAMRSNGSARINMRFAWGGAPHPSKALR
jgi:TonB family protein